MENLMPYLKKILAVLLAVLTPSLTLLIAVEPTATLDLRDEIVEYKIGGFMKGVCHADPDYELIKEANIGWTPSTRREEKAIPESDSMAVRTSLT